MANEAAIYVHRVFSPLDKAASQNTNERATAKVMMLFSRHGKGAKLASSKGAAFGLLNAVTEFVESVHVR
jgi:hypothetical protein